MSNNTITRFVRYNSQRITLHKSLKALLSDESLCHGDLVGEVEFREEEIVDSKEVRRKVKGELKSFRNLSEMLLKQAG